MNAQERRSLRHRAHILVRKVQQTLYHELILLDIERQSQIAEEAHAAYRSRPSENNRRRLHELVERISALYDKLAGIEEHHRKGSWWSTLGVPKDAPLDAIKEAYHRLSKKLHPDIVGPGHEWHFAEVSTAYANAIRERKQR